MNQVLIIAEAGVNHNGSLERAIEMIDVASEAQVDAVKFQTFKTSNLAVPHIEKAAYQKKQTAEHESSFEMLQKLELDEAAHITLKKHCQSKNIIFMSSPFDLESIDLLARMQCPIFKIGSGEITNLPYLERIGQLNRQVILSTGMANLKEISDALYVLTSSGTDKEKITVLHATTEYPAPFDEVNLRAMQTIAETFKIKVGYSDHTKGIEIPIAAVALGACVIEKHFTLDRRLPGPDHQASIEPHELKQMVASIRHVEQALGNGRKIATPSEAANKSLVRKAIVANLPIQKGEILTTKNLTTKRAGQGISPMFWYDFIGQKANRNYDVHECLDPLQIQHITKEEEL